MNQPTLFEHARMGFRESMDLTAQSLRAYGANYRHWAVAFSGGKDSTATVTVVAHLIETGAIPAPENLTVLFADTRMELPPLHAAAMNLLRVLRERGIKTQVVLPPMDDRFFVYMLGRGVPPPSNTFRWCTAQLKIEPMIAALRSAREAAGEKLLMLTGVRLGESAARDQRIALSCSRDGAECGQGWFQEATPAAVADTLAPLLHWRVCFVWDWLFAEAPSYGYPTALVAESYGGDEAEETNARTGCAGCNLASKDTALDTVLRSERWQYLAPLRELRPFYAELKKPARRLRKDGSERRKDGSLVSNPCRMGPLTLDARRWGLGRVLDIQSRINAGRGDMPEVILIDDAEQARILELIDANTWPQKWDGTEPLASDPFENVDPTGATQTIMRELLR